MSVPEIDPQEVDIAQAILLDTREESEHLGARINSGILLQPDRLEAEVESLLPDKEAQIVVYCATGRRSQRAVEIMIRKGYQNVQNMRGGIEAWRKAGLPVESSRLERYSRQTLLPEVGREGQEQLFQSRVLVVGAGGLGSPLALYLAAAGVGKLGIVDDDLVDVSNLQRQILHNEERVGTPKIASAKETLQKLNSETSIQTYNLRLDHNNALRVLEDYDAVVDGSDNFATRYLLADVTQRLGQPLISAAILGFQGQLSTFLPEGPCYRCLFPEPPPPEIAPSCSQAGILGSVAGVLGTMQATEVLKVLLGVGNPLQSRLLLVDLLQMHFQELPIHKNPDCLLCGKNKGQDLPDYQEICRV